MAEYKITKKFGRKISVDYQSWEFLTELSKTVDVSSAEELINESTKLYNQAKGLTDTDIENTKSEIKPQEVQ